MRSVLACSVAVALSFGGAAFGQMSQVSYANLTGSGFEGFDGFPGGPNSGTNYDGIVSNGNVAFAEKFAGQTLSASGNFDVLGGSPVGALSLSVGAAGRNLNMFDHLGSNIITGLGPLGYPSFDAIGEGSLAFLFRQDQAEFGFQLAGGNGGNAYLSFFRRDGSLVQSITVSNLAEAYYGFSRDGGIQDIAGVSIYNDDIAGIGLDNLKFTVPAPGSMALLAMGGLMTSRRRR